MAASEFNGFHSNASFFFSKLIWKINGSINQSNSLWKKHPKWPSVVSLISNNSNNSNNNHNSNSNNCSNEKQPIRFEILKKILMNCCWNWLESALQLLWNCSGLALVFKRVKLALKLLRKSSRKMSWTKKYSETALKPLQTNSGIEFNQICSETALKNLIKTKTTLKLLWT